jgi:GxxExxY protein
MGVLFDVHKNLGSRYQEKYYQRAVAMSFDNMGLKYKKELPVNLSYNSKIIGKYILDFLVEDKIIVELKTVVRISREDIKQVLGYLKVKKLELGIIANFRAEHLIFKRIINSDLKTIRDHSETNS